jgi:hypothetical protein
MYLTRLSEGLRATYLDNVAQKRGKADATKLRIDCNEQLRGSSGRLI